MELTEENKCNTGDIKPINMETTYTVEGVESPEKEGLFKKGDLRVEITENGKSHLQWFRNINEIDKSVEELIEESPDGLQISKDGGMYKVDTPICMGIEPNPVLKEALIELTKELT